jgi:hypothetical protein
MKNLEPNNENPIETHGLLTGAITAGIIGACLAAILVCTAIVLYNYFML